MSTLIYESMLEIQALEYLNSLKKSKNENQTRNLADRLISEMRDKKSEIFNLRATGNLGIGLANIIKNDHVYNIINSDNQFIDIVFMSYWSINNELKTNYHDNLILHRGIVVGNGGKAFERVLDEIDDIGKRSHGMFTLTSFLANNSKPVFSNKEIIENLCLHDFYSIKSKSDLGQIYFQNIVKHGANFNATIPKNILESKHDELRDYIFNKY